MLGPHIDRSRVGAAGFSIGGLTALVAGGARTDPERMKAFCRANPQDGTCQPQIEYPLSPEQAARALADPVLATERAQARMDHSIPGVKAIFAMAPVVQPLTPDSLRALRIPVSIVVGQNDITVPERSHARVARALIRGAKLKVLPAVTHYSFLATCTSAARAQIDVCRHATNQEEAHRVAIEMALKLFDRALR